MEHVYQAIEQRATWWNLLFVFVLGLLFLPLFPWRQGKLNENGEKITTFDGRWSYTRDEAGALLEKLGPENRRFYVKTQLLLDLLFPFVYTLLMALLLFRAFDNPGYLLLIPLTVLAADLLENTLGVYMTLTYVDGSGLGSPVTRLASAFTSIKWSGVTTATVLIVARVIFNISRRFI